MEAGRNEVSKFDWSTGQVQDITPIPLRDREYRTDRTEPIMFSPLDPHILYYAANVLFKTTDGGHAWQTISPDLTRPHPGMPRQPGEPCRQEIRDAGKAARRDLRARALVPKTSIRFGREPTTG